jgi:Icc-related predicted phosphoesterase
MPRRKINKSQAVRELLSANPKMKAKEIITTLAEKGITVRPSLVYFLKAKRRAKKHRATRERVATVSGNHDPVTVIRRVKSFAEEVGGLRKLKELVEALTE